jgi:hypothetical protein
LEGEIITIESLEGYCQFGGSLREVCGLSSKKIKEKNI